MLRPCVHAGLLSSCTRAHVAVVRYHVFASASWAVQSEIMSLTLSKWQAGGLTACPYPGETGVRGSDTCLPPQ